MDSWRKHSPIDRPSNKQQWQGRWTYLDSKWVYWLSSLIRKDDAFEWFCMEACILEQSKNLWEMKMAQKWSVLPFSWIDYREDQRKRCPLKDLLAMSFERYWCIRFFFHVWKSFVVICSYIWLHDPRPTTYYCFIIGDHHQSPKNHHEYIC